MKELKTIEDIEMIHIPGVVVGCGDGFRDGEVEVAVVVAERWREVGAPIPKVEMAEKCDGRIAGYVGPCTARMAPPSPPCQTRPKLGRGRPTSWQDRAGPRGTLVWARNPDEPRTEPSTAMGGSASRDSGLRGQDT